MREWTPSALEEKERFFDSIRPSLEATEADAAEVIDDLRRHLDEEVASSGLAVVTGDDVRRILARLNPLDEDEDEDEDEDKDEDTDANADADVGGDGSGGRREAGPRVRPASPGPALPVSPTPARLVGQPEAETKGTLLLTLFGVVLPLITVAVEAITGFCAGVFFDPLPTPAHVVLALVAPAGNLAVVWALRNGRARPATLWAAGAATGAALFFALLFLPLLPLGVMALVFFGLGLLPLTPALALVASLRGRRRVRRLIPVSETTWWHRWGGMLAVVALFVALDLPRTVTRVGLTWAASPVSATSARGVRFLRWLGSRDVLLRSCYQRSGRATDLVGLLVTLGGSAEPAQARKIYYRVTGQPFNALPAPRLRSLVGGAVGRFDGGRAGRSVGGRVEGLSLASSRLDGSLDAEAALGYLEWTLEFANDTSWQQEARAQVLLPPGGVVSRLTLWIDDEEREAAFGPRGVVRRAYDNVVRRRRDPVLVTTRGPDRVLVQCFPVPPGGGRMKTRLGITFPLRLHESRQDLTLPRFVERNFSLGAGVQHSVWIESRMPLSGEGTGLQAETLASGVRGLRGRIADDALGWQSITAKTAAPGPAWAFDPRSKGHAVHQRVVPRTMEPPRKVVMVVDGSAALASAAAEIGDGVRALPPGIEFELIFATDVPRGEAALGRDEAAERLVRFEWTGGQDNVPALLRAWDHAAESPGSVIVWIHGPQPVLLTSVEELRQRWERRPAGPRLFSFVAAPGPNRVLEQLDGVTAVERVARHGTPREDLQAFFSGWSAGRRVHTLVRERVPAGALASPREGKHTSDHLVRLWAFDRIRSLMRERPVQRKAAAELAVAYQLVTPVSGAVVLETAREFKAAGLTPAESGEVPTIPEPETWMLLIVVAAALLLAVRRRRSSWNAPATS